MLELKKLIANKADVNAPDADGRTAMFYAASTNWKAMIQLLHNAGAKITQQDINAASQAPIRRYMRSLLAPPRSVPRAVNAAPRPAVRRMVIPRTNGWKKGEKKWNITLEHAIIKARPYKKKIFVLFTGADWCNPCKMLEKQVLSSSDFRRLSRQMELVYINFPRNEKMPQTQRNYNEKLRRELSAGGGVPTVIILDHNGKQIGRIGGYRPKDRYIPELKNLLRK
jgi:thioredoxin-related protein